MEFLIATAKAITIVVSAVTAFIWNPIQCRVTIDRFIGAPSGAAKVAVYEKDCGATTPYNTQLSVVDSSDRFSVFRHKPFLVLKGRYELTVEWVSDKRIRVKLPPRVDIYWKDKANAGGIEIIYERSQGI